VEGRSWLPAVCDRPLPATSFQPKQSIMSKLTIVAEIIAKPDRIELVKAELLKLIPITLAEKGCINYDLHQDLGKPEHFLFYENWETREDWLAHSEARHLKDYVAATEGAVAAFTVHQMTPVG
jgi:quinol monooxygenase YgiN